MRKFGVLVLAAVTAMLLAVGGGSAIATEHNQRSCEESGGTWTSEQGQKKCVKSTTEEGTNPKHECTTTEEESGRGNLLNKALDPVTNEDSNRTGSGKCPPGQFPD